MRTTHTLALLHLPQAVVDVIRAAMLEAGYEHAVHPDEQLLDMTGIGITDLEIEGSIPRPEPIPDGGRFPPPTSRGLPPLDDLDALASDAMRTRPEPPGIGRSTALANAVRFCRGIWPREEQDVLDWQNYRFTRAEFREAAQGQNFA